MGLQAVLLAFVIPLVIVVGAIVTGTNLQWDETTSLLIGLSSFAALLLYTILNA